MLKNNDFGIYSGGTGGGGGGVQSVTGLNTNNTDPANPIVQISVDGTTITGAGTPASPLAITTALPVIDMDVNLSANDYNLDGAGIYRITTLDLTDTYIFNFNDIGILDGSKVILTNSNISNTHFAYVAGVDVTVVYQGTQQLVTQIPSGMTYEFIYNSAGGTWYCLNPTPQIAPAKIDLDAWGNTYVINTPGFFTFYNNTTGYDIGLPDPAQFNGLQLVIWNQFNGLLGYSSSLGNVQPVNSTGVSITSLANRSVDVLCSMDGEWLKVN